MFLSGKVVQIRAVSGESLQLAEVEVYGNTIPGEISFTGRLHLTLKFNFKNKFPATMLIKTKTMALSLVIVSPWPRPSLSRRRKLHNKHEP